ncbi:unnamed protein product, partial [Symbiodinium necroappetens]
GGLPFPGLDAVTSALPSPGPQQRALPTLKKPDVVRPRNSSIWRLLLCEGTASVCPLQIITPARLVVMERFMRAVPFWQPLREKEILPTAESDLEDEMMSKRSRDAVLGALLLIGVAVAMAQFFAAVGNCVAERTASKKPVASSRNACVLTDDEGFSEAEPMLKAPEKESAGMLTGFYEYELSLGLGKSTVYYVLHNGFLLAGASVTWDGSWRDLEGSQTSVREPIGELEPAAQQLGARVRKKALNSPPDFLLAKFLRSVVIQSNLVICRRNALPRMLMMMLAVVVGSKTMWASVRVVGLGQLGTAPATALAKVLMSWCMMNNMMLGSAGIVWEAIGLWLVASLSETRLLRPCWPSTFLGTFAAPFRTLVLRRTSGLSTCSSCVDWPEGAKPMGANDLVCLELVEANRTSKWRLMWYWGVILASKSARRFVEQIWNMLTSAWATSILASSDCIFTASVLQLAACAEDDRIQQRGRVLK